MDDATLCELLDELGKLSPDDAADRRNKFGDELLRAIDQERKARARESPIVSSRTVVTFLRDLAGAIEMLGDELSPHRLEEIDRFVDSLGTSFDQLDPDDPSIDIRCEVWNAFSHPGKLPSPGRLRHLAEQLDDLGAPEQTAAEITAEHRTAKWFGDVTSGNIYPGLLARARKRGLLGVRPQGRWFFRVEDVAKMYPEWAEQLRRAAAKT